MTITKNSLQKLELCQHVSVICGLQISGAMSDLFAQGHSIHDVGEALTRAAYICMEMDQKLNSDNVVSIHDHKTD